MEKKKDAAGVAGHEPAVQPDAVARLDPHVVVIDIDVGGRPFERAAGHIREVQHARLHEVDHQCQRGIAGNGDKQQLEHRERRRPDQGSVAWRVFADDASLSMICDTYSGECVFFATST